MDTQRRTHGFDVRFTIPLLKIYIVFHAGRDSRKRGIEDISDLYSERRVKTRPSRLWAFAAISGWSLLGAMFLTFVVLYLAKNHLHIDLLNGHPIKEAADWLGFCPRAPIKK